MSPVAAPARAPKRAPSRPASNPSRPDLYVVKPPVRSAPAVRRSTRRAPSRGLLGIIAVGLLFIVLFAIAVLQTVLVQGQMQLDELQQQMSDQQAEAQRLRLEAATLASPDNVVAAAQEMGMTAPAGGPTFVPAVSGDEIAPDAGLPADPTTAGQMASPATPVAGETAAPVP